MKINLDRLGEIWAKCNVEELLHQKYKEMIRIWFSSFTFDGVEMENMDGDTYLADYIGTVMNVFPSGKYYTFWTTNQTVKDVLKDSAFREAFEEILEEHNMWLENGEGSATDLFICKNKENDDEETTEEQEKEEG